MTGPGRQLSTLVFLTFLTGLFADPSLAQGSACDDVRARIAEKIRNNGVPAFDLYILDRDEETPWKIVGSCNGGANKIAYARGTPREQAATLQAHEAARLALEGKTAPAQPGLAQQEPVKQEPRKQEPPKREPAKPALAKPGPSMPVPGTPASAAAATSATAATTAPSGNPAATGAVPAGDNPGAALWTGGEERQCHLVRPKGWLTDRTLYGDAGKAPSTGAPIQDFEIDILPPSGHGLAAKGAAFSFRIRPHYLHELRPIVLASYPDAIGFNKMLDVPLASLTGNERDFRTSAASLARADADEWKRASGLTTPGLIDGVGSVQLLVKPEVEWKPVEVFRFRAREQGESAASIATHRIRVWSDGRALRTQAVLNPVYRSASGGGSLTQRRVYEYGCWASTAMSVPDFVSICSAFIERSTLGPDFPAKRCVAAQDGIAFGPR